MNLGMVYDSQGKLEQAIAAWERVPESLPERYASAQYNIGTSYVEQGKPTKSSRGLGTYSCERL